MTGFMFHSKHIGKTGWGASRCGDFRTAESLASSLKMKWIDSVLVQANPKRNVLGGLGLKEDKKVLLKETKITAIVMGYESGESTV